MKKLFSFLLTLSLLPGVLTGCGVGIIGGADGPTSIYASGGGTDKPVTIVTTVFPAWDWVRQLLGGRADSVNLILLTDSGVDLHSYQPSVDDIVTISTCDLFLCVGGQSDGWVRDALSEAVNRDMAVLNLLDALGGGVKEEEIREGMQEAEQEGEQEYDEHVWLSLKNAQILCAAIADALAVLLPEDADAIGENLSSYQARLSDLDGRYMDAVQDGRVHTLLFGDRFPFRYLLDDYGLDYYAAFSGCSAETEASFETVVFLAGKVDALDLPAVLAIENSDGRIARTIVENTAGQSAKILRLNSMQSAVTQDGETYLDIMERNLEVLRAALA